jgi:signal transduction histidine kinase/FixJ family two-component response regulator
MVIGQSNTGAGPAKRILAAQPLSTLFSGGGEMAERMRRHDWASTGMGPAEGWSQGLRTAIGLCLGSRLCGCIYWGPEHLILYNDAYGSILGTKHPSALAKPAREVWAEIFGIIGPLMQQTLQTGATTGSDDAPIFLNRSGYIEEFYCSYSYTPLMNEFGEIEGVFATLPETSTRVIGERRLHTLQQLGSSARNARNPEETLAVAANVISQNPYDIPFAAMYLWDEKGGEARLCAVSNIGRGSPASPKVIRAGEASPLSKLVAASKGKRIEILEVGDEFRPLPNGAWSIPPETILVIPLPSSGAGAPSGFIIAGASPYKRLQNDYLTFFHILADQITGSIMQIHTFQQEGARLRALAELDRAKTTFFSNVSHELRTPLTLILGPLEETLKGSAGPLTVQQTSALDIVHRNALRLLKLVNALLDFARIQAGYMQATFEPADLSLLTAQLVSSFEWAAGKAGIRLVIDCPPMEKPVYVDRDMWEKIVLNLLANAFKYTLRGEIRVSLRQVDNWAELMVHDTGVGIPEQELPRIFERFHRVEEAGGRTQEGTGIGLALIKELVKHHGGRIRVGSVVGQSTVFTISIPLGTAHLPKQRIGARRTQASTRLSASVYVEEARRSINDGSLGEMQQTFEYRSEALACAPLREPRRARKHQILLADDNADMREYVGKVLSGGFAVQAVADGSAALAAVRKSRPDLVIADVMMPHLDGLGLLRKLRADPETRAIPVILLTARAAEESRIEGLEHGADDYLVKPFSAPELLARANSAIKLSHMRTRVVQQEERLRIGRDLHDTVLQSLQGTGFLLEAGLEKLKVDPSSATRFFEQALLATGQAALEGREVLSVLRASVAERHDLVESLSGLGNELVTEQQMRFAIEVAGDRRALKPHVWNEVYAICREAVSNAARHSGATTIGLKLCYQNDLQVLVVDNGCGMSTELVTNGRVGHFGLQGMRERTERLGARVVFEGGPGVGTTVRLEFPGATAYAS